MRGFGFGNVGFVGSLGGKVNRGLQFSPTIGGSVDLSLGGTATALTGSAWSMELRVRLDAASGGAYLISRFDGYNDEYSIVYNFVANTIEFYAASPAVIRLPLTTTTPPGAAFYTVRFTYDGTTLRGFLNGAAAGSMAAPALGAGAGYTLRLGRRADTPGSGLSFSTIDYFRITIGAASPVLLELNEAASPYANTGTAGGTIYEHPVPASSVIITN